jgi:hypothetical protein
MAMASLITLPASEVYIFSSFAGHANPINLVKINNECEMKNSLGFLNEKFFLCQD